MPMMWPLVVPSMAACPIPPKKVELKCSAFVGVLNRGLADHDGNHIAEDHHQGDLGDQTRWGAIAKVVSIRL